MILEKAIISDNNKIFNVVHNSIKTIYPQYYSEEIVDFFCNLHCRENIRRDIEHGKVYKLVNNGIVVGTGCIDKNHITRLYVHPDYQHKGFGTYIMNELEKIICRDYSEILLDTSLPAKEFYLNLGYKVVSAEQAVVDKNIILGYEVMKKLLLK